MYTKFLSVLLLLVAFCFATDIVTTSGVNYESLGFSATISSTTGFDTLSGVDSVTLITNYIPQKGCETILVKDASSGYSQDSLFALVYVDALDLNGNTLFRTLVDTLVNVSTVTPGIAISLPMVGGAKYKVKLVTTSATGGQSIINRAYLLSRRALTLSKPWN